MISSILTLVIAFLCLIVLMIIHEFGHFIIAKKFGVRVDEFGIGYPPRIFGKKFGETIYSINWIPLGAFVRIYGEEGGIDDYRSFIGLKIWKRVLIVIGGVAAFWIAAIIIFSVVFAIGTDLPVGDEEVQGLTNPRVVVSSVQQNSPAETAGLKQGDVLLQINETKIGKIKDFQDFTKAHAGEEVVLKINRGGADEQVSLSPRANPPQGQGAVGVALDRIATLVKKTSWYAAPVEGAIYTWKVTASSVVGLYDVFKNLFMAKGLPEGAQFAGPLGISVFLANAASYGAGFFLYFIGMICVFIAIFNLFPIPALDGGKLIFLLIEKIKRKPVSAKIEQKITIVFFLILICLSIFITVKFDFPRIAEYFKSAMQK